MPLTPLTTFTEDWTTEPDDLNSKYSDSAQIKALLNSRSAQVNAKLTEVINLLLGVTLGDSGADNVGVNESIIGSGATVRERLEWLYAQIQGISLGAVPDGSLTEAKLAASLAELQIHYGIDTGVANAYVVALSTVPTAYTDGMALAVKIGADSTGASTINVNDLGPKTIKGSDGLDIDAGDLKAGSIYTLRYNGTNFIVQGKGGVTLTGSAIDSHVISGDTYYNTDAKTKRTGTMVNNGAIVYTPTTADQTVAEGYHNGLGKVKGDANLIAANILSGKSIFGVAGILSPGKQYASGTATASGNSLTVSGLSFAPKVIAVYYSGQVMLYNDRAKAVSGATSIARYASSAWGAGGTPTLTSNGFTIQTPSNLSYAWEATD